MDKIKIGLPRSMYFYYYYYILRDFFHDLKIELVISPKTNRQIVEDGINISNDEMCLSLKLFFGHLNQLIDKCDYILVMHINNYGLYDQTCTNYTSLYDLTNNLTDKKVIDLNIDLKNYETLEDSLVNCHKIFKRRKRAIKKAYREAILKDKKRKRNLNRNNINKLNSDKTKILIVGHPYIIYDEYYGAPIIEYLKKLNIEIIYSDLFDEEITSSLSKKLSTDLYWKYEKEKIGAIELVEENVNGIVFISAFPCGPDSLVNELVIRKLKKPYISINMDDINAFAGIETRLESFVDILEQT